MLDRWWGGGGLQASKQIHKINKVIKRDQKPGHTHSHIL